MEENKLHAAIEKNLSWKNKTKKGKR